MRVYFVHEPSKGILGPFFTISSAWGAAQMGTIHPFDLPMEVHEFIRTSYLQGSPQISGETPANLEVSSLLANLELPHDHQQKGE